MDNLRDFLFTTDANNQKILANFPAAVSVTSGTGPFTYPYSHNLEYIPSVRVWYEPEPGNWYPLSNVQLQDSFSTFLGSTGFYSLNENVLTVSINNHSGIAGNVNIWIRIYLDD